MIIGIGGVSRAGKTSLADKLATCYPDKKTAVLHMDEYITAGYNIPSIQDQIDWENPYSIDFQRLIYDFHWLGKNVDILILEGLFAFYQDELNAYYDKKILVEIDYPAFYERKIKDERYGKIPEWYINHIWRSYELFGNPEDRSDMLVLSGAKPIDMELVMSYLKIEEKVTS